MITKDVSTSTDSNSSSYDYNQNTTSPDVRLYRLRTDISESEHVQTIGYPLLSPDNYSNFSPIQCQEILRFLLLSGERLSQMTKTYHDLEAVTSLLEEKERDLELAAHIGQTLLAKNKTALEENEDLEEKLSAAVEEASQLRHEITRKDCLINMYAENESEPSNGMSPRSERNLNTQLNSHLENLQRKIRELEDENETLVTRQANLQEESSDMQNKEEHLITETIAQINYLKSEIHSANDKIRMVTDELSKRNTEALLQQDNIRILIDEMRYLQEKHSGLSEKHEELQRSLSNAYNSQFRLTREVQTLEDKYREVLSLLDDGFPFDSSTFLPPHSSSPSRSKPTTSIPFHQSLASELQDADSAFLQETCGFGDDVPTSSSTPLQPPRTRHNPAAGGDEKSNYARVLETTKEINKKQQQQQNNQQQYPPCNNYQQHQQERPDSIRLDHMCGTEMVTSPSISSGICTPQLGRPGIPGTNDLDVALKKLNLIKTRISLIAALTKKINLRPKYGRKLGRNADEGGSLEKTDEEKCRKDLERNEKLRKNKSVPMLRAVKSMQDSTTLWKWKDLASSPRGISLLSSPNRDNNHQFSDCVTRSQSLTVRTMLCTAHNVVTMATNAGGGSAGKWSEDDDGGSSDNTKVGFHISQPTTTTTSSSNDSSNPKSLSLPPQEPGRSVMRSPPLTDVSVKKRATFMFGSEDENECSPSQPFNTMVDHKPQAQIRMIKSSPHLLGLAAALMPSTSQQSPTSLVLRGSPAFRMIRSTSTSQSSLLFQDLHGRSSDLR